MAPNSKETGIKGERENWLALARYVDDVIAASRWLCPGCIEKLIKVIYSQTISFDRACDELTTINQYAAIKFLDLWVYLGWDSHFFGLVNRNDMFAITGFLILKAKNRFPIPYGETSMIIKRLTADFQARLAKYKQLRISKDEAYLYITLDIAELLRLGFSQEILLFVGPGPLQT